MGDYTTGRAVDAIGRMLAAPPEERAAIWKEFEAEREAEWKFARELEDRGIKSLAKWRKAYAARPLWRKLLMLSPKTTEEESGDR